MRALVVLGLVVGCEHGTPPDGVSAPLHGVWRSGATSETLTFDENTNVFTWTDRTRSDVGTFVLDGTELSLSCPQCQYDGQLQVRVDNTHMLFGALSGSAAVQNGSRWTGGFTRPDPVCHGGDVRFINTITLGATEITDEVVDCCLGMTECTNPSVAVGRWEKSANGFVETIGTNRNEFFLLAGGVSAVRWTRE